VTAEAALAGLARIQGGFQVGDRVRALWLGEDRHDWPGWYASITIASRKAHIRIDNKSVFVCGCHSRYPATITEAFRDNTFSLLYDDGYRGRKVPVAAIQVMS